MSIPKKIWIAIGLLIPQLSFSACGDEIPVGTSGRVERTGWGVTGELLYWYAHEQGIGYTNRPADVLTTDNFTKGSVVRPSFEWELGFRLGTGYMLKDCQWTFQADWTSLKSQAGGHRKVDSGAPEFLGSYPIWSMGPDTLVGDYISSASVKWHLSTNIVDLYAQYNYSCFHERLTLMPFLGIRGAFLNQKLKAKYAGGTFFTGIDVNTLHSHYASGGPRLGLTVDCYLIYGLGLFGQGAVTPLFGSIHVRQKEQYLGKERFHRSREGYHFVLSTDYAVGLKWQRLVLQKQLGVTLSAAWEGQEFFYANSFYRGSRHFFSDTRHLFLQGVTFTIALDF